jgi:hypothetical protein
MAISGKFPRGALKAADLFRANGTKVFVLLAATVSLAGCDALYGKPNVYKLPVARAYQKLMAVVIKPSGTGPFGRMNIETSGKRNQSVDWTIKGQTGHVCGAILTALDAEQTRIDISCAGGEGAESGLLAKMMRKGVIELVDATLKDRPFDPKKAADGATAAFWPADVIDHGNLGTAAAKALAMDRQVAEDLRDIRNSSGNR